MAARPPKPTPTPTPAFCAGEKLEEPAAVPFVVFGEAETTLFVGKRLEVATSDERLLLSDLLDTVVERLLLSDALTVVEMLPRSDSKVDDESEGGV